MPAEPASSPSITLRTLARTAREGGRFACLTCYDATTARWLAKAGVQVLLVGDTAAEVILGLPGTIHAPLDFMITLTAAVQRGASGCVVMGDMPFMSYQVNQDQAMHNAARFLTEGRADCVKLEVDRGWAPLVERLSRAGIPVVAHIGSRPQQAKSRGGNFSVGRTAEQAIGLLHDAAAMEAAGASMLLVEAAPAEVTARIVERATIPVIGCGAGPACHGQVVVLQDLLGLSTWQPPFAAPAADLGAGIEAAARQWCETVRSSRVPDAYPMQPHELQRLQAMLLPVDPAHAKT
jgi:3-methyl-2-oxobutanoate hydroxymethyltransferase